MAAPSVLRKTGKKRVCKLRAGMAYCLYIGCVCRIREAEFAILIRAAKENLGQTAFYNPIRHIRDPTGQMFVFRAHQLSGRC